MSLNTYLKKKKTAMQWKIKQFSMALPKLSQTGQKFDQIFDQTNIHRENTISYKYYTEQCISLSLNGLSD